MYSFERFKKVNIVIIAVLISISAMVQSIQAETDNSPIKVKLQAVLTPSYIIGPGDEILISDRTLKDLFGNVENYTLVVPADGNISIPLPDGTQKNVLAAGQTLDELSAEIRDLFGQTLKNPLVFVQINKFRPINVYIGGSVVKPGVYKIEKTSTKEEGGNTTSSLNTFGLTLSEAIQIAGGLKPRADITKVTVTRGISSDKKVLNLKNLIHGGTILNDISLQPGDAIYVPVAEDINNQAQTHVKELGKLAYQEVTVSVVGEAKKTGSFVLPNDGTILDAIGEAGGLNEVGTLKKIRLSRFDDDGIYRTHKLNVHDLIHDGSSFDTLAIKPGDRIELVASKGKEVRHFFRDNASSFISPAVGSLGNFIVQDALISRPRRSVTTSTINQVSNSNDSGGSGGVVIIGE